MPLVQKRHHKFLTAQFRYFKIQHKTMDTTLRGINPTNPIVYSPEPRAETLDPGPLRSDLS